MERTEQTKTNRIVNEFNGASPAWDVTVGVPVAHTAPAAAGALPVGERAGDAMGPLGTLPNAPRPVCATGLDPAAPGDARSAVAAAGARWTNCGARRCGVRRLAAGAVSAWHRVHLPAPLPPAQPVAVPAPGADASGRGPDPDPVPVPWSQTPLRIAGGHWGSSCEYVP
eukprot:gene19261-biopygen35039